MLTQTKVMEYLKRKTKISVPEIQKEFACGYGEAKKKLQYLIENDWVGDTVEGIWYPVHVLRVWQKDLPGTECELLVEDLEEKDLSLLEDLVAQEQGKINRLRMQMEDHENQLQKLIALGLVHVFHEKYFLSVTAQTVTRLKESFVEEADDFLIEKIAYPILVSCVTSEEDGEELLENPFLPSKCKQYIEKGIARYRNEGKKPQKLRGDVPNGDGNILKFEVIEAFLKVRVLSTKKQYEVEAKKQGEIICNSKHCAAAFKRAVEAAVKEIVEELTLGNIREIQRILADAQDD